MHELHHVIWVSTRAYSDSDKYPVLVLYSALNWASRPRANKRNLRDAAPLTMGAVFGLIGKGVQLSLYERIELDDVRFQVLLGSRRGR